MVESCVTFLPVEDLERTTRFYAETVGLPLWKDMGQCRIFSCGAGYFGFCRYEDGRPMASGVCLSLNLPDCAAVDAAYARLLAAGAKALQPPQKHGSFPVYSCFFSDPNGYLLEFQKILD